MSATTLWFRADLRTGWRATLGVALLLGVAAGASLTAAAGARRTDSAYPRFLAKYGAFHTEVSTGGDPETDEIFDAIAELPQVVATSRDSLFVATVTAGGHTVSFPDVFLIAGHDDRSRVDEARVIHGRPADPKAVDEAVVGYAFAERLGLSPGDTMTVAVRAPVDAAGTGEQETLRLRLVGVVAAVGSFETLTGRGFPNIVGLTPAFFRAHRLDTNTDEDTMSVALRHGEADLAGFADELRRREIRMSAPQPASAYTSDVQAVNRVPVVALWVTAGLLALAAVAIFGQTIGRETLARAADFQTLRSLGMSRAALTFASVGRATVVGVGSAAVAVGVAVLASPLMPLGLARVAEPDPGFDTDWLVLVFGAAGVVVFVSAVSSVFAYSAARRAEAPRRAGRGARPAVIAGAVSRAGLPPPMTSGVRLATRASAPSEPVPVRSAFVGTTFAITALTAALVFASSLEHLVHEPRLFGSSWDAAVIANPGGLDDLAASLPLDLVADRWKGTVFRSARVDGLLLAAFASERPSPSIIKGRAPETPDEVALDPRTLERLDKGLGDAVSVAGVPGEEDQASASRRMRIVGSFAVPRLPFQSDENPGQGAAFTPGGLSSISGGVDFDSVYVTFRSGVDPVDGVQRLKEATAEDAYAVISTQSIGAVRGVQRISAAPWYLAGALAVLAIGTLAHTLLLTTRRRRRDLAILKTLGFVGRQVRATVVWLGVAIVAPALVLGLPIGIVAGRWGWRRFAEYLAVVPEPVAPAAGALLIAVAVIAVILVIAAGAAEIAVRVRPATVLRTE